ncbi:MAG: tRNA (adenosine(37)-N6)-threonylcarbamoyltransferase complex ATPase subunit type 1 TsaE [Acidiferrobacterales bacterium]
MEKTLYAKNEAEMADLAKKLVNAGLAKLGLVTLGGMLGAGKTTLVKEILRALGYQGLVKSPTFTLAEPYQFGQYSIMHLDLYRLEDPQEIEFLGYREWFSGNKLVLVEWPEKAHGFLPEPDLNVMIQIQENRRQILLESGTTAGNLLLEQLIT